jgi:hypothetical protein
MRSVVGGRVLRAQHAWIADERGWQTRHEDSAGNRDMRRARACTDEARVRMEGGVDGGMGGGWKGDTNDEGTEDGSGGDAEDREDARRMGAGSWTRLCTTPLPLNNSRDRD